MNNEELTIAVQELTQRLNNLKPRLLDIEGVIRTTTVIPTSSPVNINDQVVVYIDDLTTPTVKRLYIYSTLARIWNYVTLT